MSNIVLNIVEPASPTPTPTEPVVPDTGLFTHGIGGPEATILGILAAAIILAVVIAVLYYRKKQGKLISLKHTKSTTGLAVLALLVSIATVAGLIKLTTNAIEGDAAESTEDSSALTVDVSSTEFTIELADQPVFAVLPVDITVAEATDLGYTLTAYTDSTNLVSTTDSSKVIPMVTVDAEDVEDIDEEASEEEAEPLDSSLVALSPNTYGLSLVDPESVADEVFTSLSTDSTTPTFITDKDYEATLENDTTTIYYGFYITPDTPYGTYTGSNITVDAIPNIATVTYNANGLYFNDSEEATENTVGYKPNIAEAPIELVTGEYLTPTPLTPVDPSTTIHYTFLGWSETEGATTPTYTNEEDILANLTLSKNESLTLYAVWHYNTVLSFNGTTSDGGEAIEQQTIAAGTTITLPQNTYTRAGSVFTNWNTVETPTVEDPGTAYSDEATFTAPLSSADITLYAQWAYTTTITFNGNGETSGSMSDQVIVAGTPQNLTPNAFAKDGYVFNGWNTVQTPTTENPGTVYADKAQYTASTIAAENVTLYAQWKEPLKMQDVATWGSTLSQGDTMEAVDKRDGQEYTVARLNDGKIWMTKNLNLAGGTEITSELSNVPDGYTLPTANGFAEGNKLPASSTSGFYDNAQAYVYNSTKTSGTDCTSSGCYSYYSWTAATAGSGLSIDTDDTDAPYSICPKGWKLPNSRSTVAGNSDFYKLAVAYGMDPSSIKQSTSNFFSQAGPGTTPNFLLTGGYYNGSFNNGGSSGYYWSSASGYSASARYLRFDSSRVFSADYAGRRIGHAVRCIAE